MHQTTSGVLLLVTLFASTAVPIRSGLVPEQTSRKSRSIFTESSLDRNPVSAASEAVRQKLDQQLASTTAQISAKQREIEVVSQQHAATSGRIASTEAQVAATQNQLLQLEASVAAANEEVRKAEDRVDRDLNCIWGKRRKREVRGWFKNTFGKVIKAPYYVGNNIIIQPITQAVSVLASKTLQPLAQAPIPVNATQTQDIVANLRRSIQELLGILNPVSAASEAVRQKLDQQLASTTAQISAKQREIEVVSQQHAATSGRIASTDAQIAETQNQLVQLEASVAAANEEVRKAEERVNRDRNCIWRWRRKREVRGWLNKIFGKVINAPCHIVNNIDAQKQDRARVQASRDQATAHLQNLQASQGRSVAERNYLQANLAALAGQRDSLVRAANTLITQQNANVALGVATRELLKNVGTFTGATLALQRIAGSLGAMADLVAPLGNAVASALGASQYQSSGMNENIRSIGESMGIIGQKLPQYPPFMVNFETGEFVDMQPVDNTTAGNV